MARLDGAQEKRVADLRIASARWYGRLDDAPARFAELRARLGAYVAWPAILLNHGESPVVGADLEATYPVSDAAEKVGIATHVLTGGNILAIDHRGVLAPASAENSWQTRIAAIRGEILDRWLIGNGPRRTAFLDAGDGLKQATDVRRLEV